MSGLASFVRVFLHVILALGLLATVGYSFLVVCRATSWLKARTSVIVSPALGLGALGVAATITAQYGVAIDAHFIWLMLLSFYFLAVIILFFPRRSSRLHRQGQRGFAFNVALVWYPLSAIVGLLPYAALFRRELFEGEETSATWINSDLGAYLLMASNLRASGIANAGLLTDVDLGTVASHDHPCAHAIVAVISGIQLREPYQVGFVAMGLVLALVFLGAVGAVEGLSRRPLNPMYGMALSATVINAGIVAAAAYFFFAQILSISFVLATLGCATAAVHVGVRASSGILLAALTVATMLTSIEISVWAIPLVVIVALFHPSAFRNWRSIAQAAGVYLASILAIVLWQRGLFFWQFDVLHRSTQVGVAGWRANYLSPTMMMGLVEGRVGDQGKLGVFSGPLLRGVDYGVFAVLVSWLGWLASRKRLTLQLCVFIGLLAAFIALAMRLWGSDAYQTWKFVLTCVPLLGVALVSVAWRRDRRRQVSWSAWVAVVMCLFTLIATMNYSRSIWQTTTRQWYVNDDLVALASSPEVARQPQLNILLESNFETMAAGAVALRPVRLVSPSNLSAYGNPLIPGCTLTTTARLPEIGAGAVMARRGDYVLIGTPTCR